MARVKIVAHFADENGNYSHSDLAKGVYVDVRDQIAEQWARNGWAICLPEKKPEVVAVSEPVAAPGDIETPEDMLPEKERATIKRRRDRL